jgi:hypothetical protein
MLDLHERLQELADAATRDGATPGPAHAIHRGRQRRRRRVAAATASLLVVALAAGATVSGRLAGRTDRPAIAPATPVPAPVDPDVRHDLPGTRSTQDMAFDDLSAELRRCRASTAGAELIGYVHSRQWHRVWMVAAKPPEPGASGLCWTSGLFSGGGAGSFSGASRPVPVADPLTASGSFGGRFGTIEGQVIKRAVRVQVRFRDGRLPLQLRVVKAADRYPVNFYIGFYPANGARGDDESWPPSEVAAFDALGRQLARCIIGPPWNTPSACPGS